MAIPSNNYSYYSVTLTREEKKHLSFGMRSGHQLVKRKQKLFSTLEVFAGSTKYRGDKSCPNEIVYGLF